MDQQGINQILRLLKRLVPKALRWWKKRQQQQQHQQQGPGPQGGFQGNQGSYNQQGSYSGQPGSYGGQQPYGGPQGSGAWSQGPPPQQQGWQQAGPHHQQHVGAPQQYGGPSYGGAPQSYGGAAGGFDQPHKPSLTYGNTSHFGQHAGHVNQDMINASDQQYVKLRNDAIHEGDLMHQAFDKASKAHDRGDGAAAKQFSNEGHEHQRRKDELNQQASQWIYQTNNKVSPPGTIDLHGLFVNESLQVTEQAIRQAQAEGRPELRIITGKGLHSVNHVAKIKPAIEDLMRRYNLAAHVDPHNTGVLIVNLQGGGQGYRDAGFADQLAAQAEGDKCIIM